MCNHELKYLMGVEGGVVCRKCGTKFDHIPKQEPAKVEAPVETVDEKPKRTRKPAAKKGAK